MITMDLTQEIGNFQQIQMTVSRRMKWKRRLPLRIRLRWRPRRQSQRMKPSVIAMGGITITGNPSIRKLRPLPGIPLIQAPHTANAAVRAGSQALLIAKPAVMRYKIPMPTPILPQPDTNRTTRPVREPLTIKATSTKHPGIPTATGKPDISISRGNRLPAATTRLR